MESVVNLRQIEVFVAVAECGKMNLAARQLFMTESTVSQAISRLEDTYQVKLFERLNKRIYLTYEGSEFLAYAKRLLALGGQLNEYMGHLSGKQPLRIGVSGSASFYLIHQLLARLNEEIPNANITLYHYSNRHIHRLIQSSELDIAMVSYAPYEDSDLVIQPVIEDRSIIVCGNKHEFWKREWIEPRQLQDQPFILRENHSGTRMIFDNFLRANELTVKTMGISNNALYCKYAVQYNPYLTCISASLCGEELKHGILHEVKVRDTKLSQTFSLIYHKNKVITPLIKTFIQLCHDYSECSDPD